MQFKFVLPAREVLYRALATLIFKKLRRTDLKLFVRTNDIISLSPILFSDHEPHMLAFLRAASAQNARDFMLDIGSNIGLTCCPVKDAFDRIVAFEPNPLAFKILEVNAAVSSGRAEMSLRNYGIGVEDATLDLMVPRHNWGGAFVVSDDNAYDHEVLARKDGFQQIDEANYIRETVEIRKGAPVFADVFAQVLDGRESARGVAKIDVEGFESSVLSELAQALPEEISLIIIFENWDPKFDLETALAAFGARGTAYRLPRQAAFSSTAPRWRKRWDYLKGLLTGRASYIYDLEPISPQTRGDHILCDLVLEISGTPED
ncbi:FkbM family methyltransferase [Primorskyibacter sp. S187A]|uniref:FkbM family methyltransferase n=1 Tax=Primorskyibacter sp. S187A TaxID=3415130 RepID=UPI003C7A1939